ncbi:flagellar biosynthesis protein FlgL [Pseudomonas sp. Root329]|jgi:flagellar hook-associated protein 3 FlgL|uniref:flagellar hook-associated protein 3 n=1 Tax=Pseudomonas sp. Root329 TaxID=1736515 RepID=UPI0006FCAF25|nr:flagellar hook-associated protein 3 [Pseudomonas sp. Root329]KQV17010.1 flagellar biosynthesis protein FlgL [Pseudomonas sp. Root329]
MRISTPQFYERSAANYQKNFNNVVNTSQEASDNLRVRTAADDPVGASRLLQLGQQSAMLDQFSTNITTIKNTLGQSETVLNSINNVLQRANELALGAGNAGYTDSERKANASELGQLESQLLSLMNSRDENGQYLFGGSNSGTAPYSRNADGTYSYHGDQTTLNLQVGDALTMPSNDTGFSIFEQALNTSRTQTTLTAPAVNDGRVDLSNGQVSGSVTYNDKFRSGEPYAIEFLSSTQFKVTDSGGNDVTAEASNNGVFDPKTAGGTQVSFRGVDLRLNINLKPGDTTPDTVIAGHIFNLGAKPDTFSATRSAGNPSTAVVTGATVSNAANYNAAFPNGGAILKFTSATNYELYASPLTANSKPVSTGTMAGSTATAAGVDFTFGGTPAAGDQYVVQPNTHQTQNILDTISKLRTALEAPIDGSAAAEQSFRASLDSAIANIGSGSNQVLGSLTSIGARGQALDIQSSTNESLTMANKTTTSSIQDSDPAEVLSRLTLQQTMLQASQLAFSKISQLGLFNKI